MFLLYLFIILFIAYLLFWPKGSSGKRAKSRTSVGPRRLVKDPVCGIYVDEEEAIKLKWQGEILYFCSEECRDKFLEQHK